MSQTDNTGKRIRAGDYIRVREWEVWKDAKVKCVVDDQLFRIEYICDCRWKGSCVHTCMIADEKKTWKRDSPQKRELRLKQIKLEELKKQKEEEIMKKREEKIEREREIISEIEDVFGCDDAASDRDRTLQEQLKKAEREARKKQAEQRKKESEVKFNQLLAKDKQRKVKLSKEKVERRVMREKERKEWEKHRILELKLKSQEPVGASKNLVWNWKKEVEEFMEILRQRRLANIAAMKKLRKRNKLNGIDSSFGIFNTRTQGANSITTVVEDLAGRDDDLVSGLRLTTRAPSVSRVRLEEGEYVVVLSGDILRVEEGPCDIVINPNVEIVGEIKKMNWKETEESNYCKSFAGYRGTAISSSTGETSAAIPAGFELYYS